MSAAKDRELLMLAAKAAGKDIDPDRYDEDDGFAIRHMAIWWNPLRNDGDEARLEAALCLHVNWYRQFVSVGGHSVYYRSRGGDKQAARRRAGVIAAAEIGKNMPAPAGQQEGAKNG